MEVKRTLYIAPGENGKRGFEDLECYKLALEVVVQVHEFARHLPAEEKFDMAVQVRRSAKSVTANIAEGYGRYHYLDSLKFYSNARGSLNETLSHVINARVLNYLEQADFDELYKLIRHTESVLNGFMNYIRKQRVGADIGEKTVREEPSAYFVDQSNESLISDT